MAATNTDKTDKLIDTSKYEYKKNGQKTKSGRASIDNGDRIAKAMRGFDRDGVTKVAKENGLDDKVKKLAHLNDGMFKMNVANMLRSAIRGGGKVKVAGKTIASLGS